MLCNIMHEIITITSLIMCNFLCILRKRNQCARLHEAKIRILNVLLMLHNSISKLSLVISCLILLFYVINKIMIIYVHKIQQYCYIGIEGRTI